MCRCGCVGNDLMSMDRIGRDSIDSCWEWRFCHMRTSKDIAICRKRKENLSTDIVLMKMMTATGRKAVNMGIIEKACCRPRCLSLEHESKVELGRHLVGLCLRRKMHCYNVTSRTFSWQLAMQKHNGWKTCKASLVRTWSMMKGPLGALNASQEEGSERNHPKWGEVGNRIKRCSQRCSLRTSMKVASSSSGNSEQAAEIEGVKTGILKFLDANFIPLALIFAIMMGWSFPAPGTAAAKANLHKLSTIGQFTISGILLQQGEAQTALRSPLALVYGIFSILFLTPMIAFLALRLPLNPPEMALGLAVFCCVPTTLSTCVTLTNACNGNAAVALLLVVCSSVVGVFTIPHMVGFILGAGAGLTNFQPAELFQNLVLTVLLPLLFGVMLQTLFKGLASWRNQNRKKLAYASTFFLCLMPWMQLSVASASNLPLTALAVCSAAVAGAGLHIAFLALNASLMRFVRFSSKLSNDLAIRKAVLLSTSEKTLPVAVAVLTSLTSIAGAGVGLAVIPCVFAHLMQIAIDSWLVSEWNKNEKNGVNLQLIGHRIG